MIINLFNQKLKYNIPKIFLDTFATQNGLEEVTNNQFLENYSDLNLFLEKIPRDALKFDKI